MSEDSVRAKQVYDWSSKQTAESRQFDISEYFPTEAYEKAIIRLENNKGILLGIQGLQGTGKSSALKAIEAQLNEDGFQPVLYKWSRDWRERGIQDVEENKLDFGLDLWEALIKKRPERITSKLKTAIGTVTECVNSVREIDHLLEREQDQSKCDQLYKQRARYQETLDGIANEETLRRLLGEKEVRKLQEYLAGNPTDGATHVLIDMPDYIKNDSRTMSKDIDELQHLWYNSTLDRRNTSFVIAIQKEIAMQKPHFFFGKFSMIELKPLTQKELVDAYCAKWETFQPFTEEALILIAKLSRGVFRRFLKYVNLTIETSLVNKAAYSITGKDVEAAVTFDVLLADMELELSDVFTQQTHKIQTTRILQSLMQDVLTQKVIAERLNVSESLVTKIIAKLELYGYVKRTRGEGSTWLVSLA